MRDTARHAVVGQQRKQRQNLAKIIAHRILTFTFTVERSFLVFYNICHRKNCFKVDCLIEIIIIYSRYALCVRVRLHCIAL